MAHPHPEGDSDSDSDTERRRGVRRTAIVLTLVALAFYAGFILLGVLRS